eukprot:scaffold547_cov87-Skeletonema_dohrnii-CCMP3373.AAC.4
MKGSRKQIVIVASVYQSSRITVSGCRCRRAVKYNIPVLHLTVGIFALMVGQAQAQAQDQSVDDKVKVSDREARSQSPVGGELYLYDIAQAQ